LLERIATGFALKALQLVGRADDVDEHDRREDATPLGRLAASVVEAAHTPRLLSM
jgi:hypothetical protein